MYKDPDKAQDAILRVASSVDEELMKLERELGWVEKYEKENNVWIQYPYDSWAYAEALLHWEAHNRDPASVFTTEDPYLLVYRTRLTSEFGLPVLTEEEAEEYKKETQRKYEKLRVTGFAKPTKELN